MQLLVSFSNFCTIQFFDHFRNVLTIFIPYMLTGKNVWSSEEDSSEAEEDGSSGDESADETLSEGERQEAEENESVESADDDDSDQESQADENEDSNSEDDTATPQEPIEVHFCYLILRHFLPLYSRLTSGFQVNVNDFVMVEYSSSKKKVGRVEYVGLVKEKLPGGKFRVQFMSQYNNRRDEFCFPIVDLIEAVENDNIISVLPRPLIRRGKHTFPYNIL